MCAKSLWSYLTLHHPIDCSLQPPLSVGFSRQVYWSELACPPPGDLPHPWIKSISLMSPALAGRFFTSSTTWETLNNLTIFCFYFLLFIIVILFCTYMYIINLTMLVINSKLSLNKIFKIAMYLLHLRICFFILSTRHHFSLS